VVVSATTVVTSQLANVQPVEWTDSRQMTKALSLVCFTLAGEVPWLGKL